MDSLLGADQVADYLRGRGVVTAPGDVAVTELAGGVSNTVFLVCPDHGEPVVFKQALARLKVADEWRADPERSQAEAAALQMFGELTPGQVPQVYDSDPGANTLAVQAAPPHWADWKQRLMRGERDASVAPWLGTLLHTWHCHTVELATIPAELDVTEPFWQLRLRPYFEVSAQRRPTVAGRLRGLIDDIRDRRVCLVSGDFSPKNVLVGDHAPGWVIDLEVAHYGDPAFDVGFMLHHLVMKAIHLGDTEVLRGYASAFLEAYDAGPGTADQRHLWTTTAALLLARCVGNSPSGYLDDDRAARLERAAIGLLEHPAGTFDELWERTA